MELNVGKSSVYRLRGSVGKSPFSHLSVWTDCKSSGCRYASDEHLSFLADAYVSSADVVEACYKVPLQSLFTCL